MKVLQTVKEINDYNQWRAHKNINVGFVPTMGALHKGHISLIDRAKRENDIVLASIFINPAQFNDQKDLLNYPRTFQADMTKLEHAGCDLLFAPSNEEIYPKDSKRTFDLSFGFLEETLEGSFRPGHFKGMAMVVDILFNIVRPQKAYFGEKDFQQLAIVRELAKRIHPELEIIACPTLREPDGLAMSSRNALLNQTERKEAVILSKTLFEVKKKKEKLPIDELLTWAKNELSKSDIIATDYFAIVESDTLRPLTDWTSEKKMRALVAAKVGKVRLIDNVEL